jgi:16S rRNA G966 N2-methylase RsmD
MEDQVGQFDIIFADPPFTDARILEEIERRVDTLSALLHNVGELSAKDSSALLVVQHHFKAKVDLSPQFTLQKSRRAGESLLSFFELSSELSQEVSESNQTSSAITLGEP